MGWSLVDSFDHYDTAKITRKWSAVLGGSSTTIGVFGRNGTSGARLDTIGGASVDGGLVHNIALSSIIVGMAWKHFAMPIFGTGSGYRVLINYGNSAGTQLEIRQYHDATIKVFRGAVELFSYAPGPSTDYHYLEADVTIHDTAGECKVWLDNNQIINLTAVDTQNQATGGLTLVRIGSDGTAANPSNGASTFDLDDVLIINKTVVTNEPNARVGDSRIVAVFPTGVGANAAWLPSAGVNWQNVDETPPDDDTTFNSSAVVGNKDTHVMSDISVFAGATIHGVAANLQMKKDDAGTREVSSVARQSGAESYGPNHTPAVAYGNHQSYFGVNPATGLLWTVAQINDAEFGYRVVV